MLNDSLKGRLIISSLLWIVSTLILTGALLVFLFEGYIERRFDAILVDHLEELVAASAVTEGNGLRLAWRPVDPDFEQSHFGWYWQIIKDDKIILSSTHLHNHLDIILPESGIKLMQEIDGPGNIKLRALIQNISFPGSNIHFTFVVAGPLNDIHRDVYDFASKLVLTLIILALGLLCAIPLQIRFGLKPLGRIQKSLINIRHGKAHKLQEIFPMEVMPVIQELNSLLDYNDKLLDRARTQAGDLAHALKTPLSVMHNEIAKLQHGNTELLKNQLNVVSDCIERQLTRVRVAGADNVLGARTAVATVADDVIFSLNILYQERNLSIHLRGLESLYFQGESQDLEEMLGNLADNACKWANSEVLISGKQMSDRIFILVEDDGPGIPEELRLKVLKRGRRLDESVPGTGIGLGIVCDITELYRGSLTLQMSSLGGLTATLELPAAL